jgi:hypothetical protein
MIFELVIIVICIAILLVGLISYFTSKKSNVIPKEKKTFTAVHTVSEDLLGNPSQFYIQFDNPDYLRIDWGDGTIEEFQGNSETHYSHTYTEAKDYTLTVTYTGNLTKLGLCGDGAPTTTSDFAEFQTIYVKTLTIDSTSVNLLYVGSQYLENVTFVTTPTNLQSLDISNNQYSIDNFPIGNLLGINLSNKGYTDVSVLPLLPNNLIGLNISDNQIDTMGTSLDYFTNLKYLYVNNNLLPNIFVQNTLEILECSNNPITALNFAGNSNLKKIDITNTQLSGSFDATFLSKLESFTSYTCTTLTSIDFQNLLNLTEILLNSSTSLSSINTTGCVNMNQIIASDCAFSNPPAQLIGLNTNVGLYNVNLSFNGISQVDAEYVAGILNTFSITEGNLSILSQPPSTLVIQGTLQQLQDNKLWIIS